MIRKYIEKIGENRNANDMEKLGDMLSEIIYQTKDSHHELYEKYKMQLYEMAYGEKIDEEMAKKWVQKMLPVGEYWTIEKTTEARNDLGYSCDKIDFYVVANMMYNDYNDIVSGDDKLALNMAKDWLHDTDAMQNKLYNYWKYIAKKD
jgi:hypothetical protein